MRVDINVRGISCLRPGVEGVSDNIRVVSIVSRFLEHSRIYGFRRGDERVYLIGSADLMPRNLDSRVELLIPVEDAEVRAEIEDTLERCFADDTFAWELDADAQWTRREGRTRDAQRELMERALDRAAHDAARAGARRARRRSPPRADSACARGRATYLRPRLSSLSLPVALSCTTTAPLLTRNRVRRSGPR